MQNGSLDNNPQHRKSTSRPESPHAIVHDNVVHNSDDGPPAKRRKIAATTPPAKSTSRPVSPPWRRIAAEGPTSFVEDGRRKSSRTNNVPLELQPQSATRQTRAAAQKVERKGNPAQNSFGGTSMKKSGSASAGKSISGAGSSQSGLNMPLVANDVARSPSAMRNNVAKHETSPVERQPKKTHAKHSSLSQDDALCRRQHSHKDPAISGQACHETQPPGSKGAGNSVTPVRRMTRKSKQESLTLSQPKYTQKSPRAKLQKIRFTVRMPSVVVQSPANIPQPRQYESLQDFLDKDDPEPKEGEGVVATQHITQEARIRRKVNRSTLHGGRLDRELKQVLPERQKEPRQYSHHDHLLAHALHFRKLLHAEYQKHKSNAKKVAYEAARRARSKIPKSAEELEQEQTELGASKYRQVVKDVSRFWAAVEAEVNTLRQSKIEEIEQDRKRQEFNEQVERHTLMLAANPNTKSADVSDEMEESLESVERSDGPSSEGSEDLSSSDTESETDVIMDDADDEDATLTGEQLRGKYANLAQASSLAPHTHDPLIATMEPSEREPVSGEAMVLDDVDQSLMDDDSDSIATDDGEDSETSNSGDDSDDSDEADDDDGEDAPTLRSLFGPADLGDTPQVAQLSGVDQIEHSPPDKTAHLTSKAEESGTTLSQGWSQIEAANATDGAHDGLTVSNPALETSNQDHNSIGASTPASPQTSVTKASDGDSFTSSDVRADSQIPSVPPKPRLSEPKTPVPSLFRGTLRVYQHEGLDWLANLYVNRRNGILADEMGLGKTIQTIVLLAHLAVEHHVWGPHLIIVPSSVLLNWEMEFKKFCPGLKVLVYYGSISERKQKRRGWMDNDLWHVVITSYQIVLQDQKNLKRRNWHYMVLDEAHNIKNFRSQRWQTMLTFKTRARLLLTGTPLQNNLTELWSLLFFLRPTDMAEDQDEAFAGLSDFSDWFKKPVDQILDQGRESMDDEAREQVTKLHKVIRPYLLRRLKADVEKQMPAKYEHVELCRLSKRQRQLYDEFMSRTKTKDTLASGNYFSIIDCLMQLRKVCNHPDLFETRAVTTSFAMARPAVADFEIDDLFVRRKMLAHWDDNVSCDFLRLAPVSNERKSALEAIESSKLQAFSALDALRVRQRQRLGMGKLSSQSSIPGALASLRNVGRQIRMGELEHRLYQEYYRHWERPIYGDGLLSRLSISTTSKALSFQCEANQLAPAWDSAIRSIKQDLVRAVPSRAATMQPLIQRFACITPVVVASGLATKQLSEQGTQTVHQSRDLWTCDPFHEARTRLAIAFPDKRLLQYDCGKLQRLDKLLRQLQAGGHRALIFTQMTKVLDILEQFLNIHGHRYLRLDGSTKIDQRQILTERFNNDAQFLAFILSSRSGGLGINLTGADTVIFYDLDWNPAMDRQCQDRCHRIGQTRDVHIYRFVSEHTIESNILRKSNQKRMLDDVVIQEGDFTTGYLTKPQPGDMLAPEDIGHIDNDDAGAALDKVLGNAKGHLGAVLETAEDREDVQAAVRAEKEDQNVDADADDFGEKPAAPVHEGVAPTAKPNPAGNTTLAPPGQHDGSGGPQQANSSTKTHATSNPSGPGPPPPPPLSPSALIGDIDSWVLESMIRWKNDEFGEIKAETFDPLTGRGPRDQHGRYKNNAKKNRKKGGGEHRIKRRR